MKQKPSGMSLTVMVLTGMGLGILVGLIINLAGLNTEGGIINEYIVNGLFLVVGTMFIASLKMLVVPLVLLSLISGVCGIGHLGTLGRVGGKAFLLYLLTTAIAIATAIGIAIIAAPGKGMNVETAATFTGKEAPPLTDVLINIVPSNPIQAMAQSEIPMVLFGLLDAWTMC